MKNIKRFLIVICVLMHSFIAAMDPAVMYDELKNMSIADINKKYNQEDGEAEYLIGIKFYYGLGVPVNFAIPSQQFFKSARKGYVPAWHMFSQMAVLNQLTTQFTSIDYFQMQHLEDLMLRKDPSLASTRATIIQPNPIGLKIEKLIEQEQEFMDAQQFEAAFHYFKKIYDDASEAPPVHLIAAYFLGKCYAEGLGVSQNDTTALSYLLEAYNQSVKENRVDIEVKAALDLGELFFKINEYQKAIAYFNVVYAKGEQHQRRQSAAWSLGNIYVALEDYEKARKYFLEVYENHFYHSMAAAVLGEIALYTDKYEEAPKYFYEAYSTGDQETRQNVVTELKLIKAILLEIVDTLLQQMPLQPTQRYIKSVRAALNKAKQIRYVDDEELKQKAIRATQRLEHIAAQISQKTKKIVSTSTAKEQQERERANQERAASVLKRAYDTFERNDLQTTKDLLDEFEHTIVYDQKLHNQFRELYRKYAERQLPELLARFDTAFAAYKHKASAERYKEAQNILDEAATLAILLKNKSALHKIKEKREELTKFVPPVRESAELSLQEPVRSAVTELSLTEEPSAVQPFFIFDPFEQQDAVAAKFTDMIHSALDMLAKNPNYNAKKLKNYNNIWRIRAGNFRILYIILPQKRAIGIISINNRKEVYKNEALNKNRESWFQERNSATAEEILREIKQERERDNEARARVLTALYEYIMGSQPQERK